VKLVGLFVFVGMAAIIYAQVFALWDVLAHQSELGMATRVLWVVTFFLMPAIGTIAYLRFGPGTAHWPPWDIEPEDD
jgi:hypothetical protein